MTTFPNGELDLDGRLDRPWGRLWLQFVEPRHTVKRLATLALLAIGLELAAASFDPFQGVKPLAVFIQSDPWAMVMGADTPRVALYEDATVIFAKKTTQ